MPWLNAVGIAWTEISLGAVVGGDVHVPETTYPRCADSQLFPPTTGLTHSDHRNPGSACNRFTVAVPRCTTLATTLAGVWVSSGLSMLLDSMLTM